jgi:GntR family transcriptional regulator, transcriptional repressor for pyruvate dehydrogenase complex
LSGSRLHFVNVGQAERHPAYQVLADELRTQITTGLLRPGERLPTEPQLSARSGLSRSTVREALRLLASQHLIVTTRGVSGGSFVAHPSPAQLSELLSTGMQLLLSTGRIGAGQLIEVRRMLEVPAAELAASRRGEDDLLAMRAALVNPDSDDLDTKLVAHRGFHTALAGATGNPIYELVCRPLYCISNERPLAERAPAGFWHRVDAEHRRLVRAITAGDRIGARTAARVHLDYLHTVYAEAEVNLGSQ